VGGRPVAFAAMEEGELNVESTPRVAPWRERRNVCVCVCVAVCCGVLQCIAVCCSVLQRVAACCSVLQCAALEREKEYVCVRECVHVSHG